MCKNTLIILACGAVFIGGWGAPKKSGRCGRRKKRKHRHRRNVFKKKLASVCPLDDITPGGQIWYKGLFRGVVWAVFLRMTYVEPTKRSIDRVTGVVSCAKTRSIDANRNMVLCARESALTDFVKTDPRTSSDRWVSGTLGNCGIAQKLA